MSYPKEFLQILEKLGYKTDSILDFKNLTEGTVTRNYADFIYENVSKPDNPFRISPFELFLLKEEDPNAFAIGDNGQYLIAIHLSLFKLLEEKIRTKVPILKDPALSLLNAVGKYAPNDIPFLIFQFISLFTYYHELGHLHQFQHSDNKTNTLFEKYNLIADGTFDRVAHAMEIDADIFAAQQIAFHILQYWSEFSDEGKNKETLEAFISLVIASIFLFFYELMDGWHDIYFLSHDHPHILIRVSYVADFITKATFANVQDEHLKPSKEKCMVDALIIAQQMLSDDDTDGLLQYITMYKENQSAIDDYITKELGPFSKTLDFLIANWHKE